MPALPPTCVAGAGHRRAEAPHAALLGAASVLQGRQGRGQHMKRSSWRGSWTWRVWEATPRCRADPGETQQCAAAPRRDSSGSQHPAAARGQARGAAPAGSRRQTAWSAGAWRWRSANKGCKGVQHDGASFSKQRQQQCAGQGGGWEQHGAREPNCGKANQAGLGLRRAGCLCLCPTCPVAHLKAHIHAIPGLQQ